MHRALAVLLSLGLYQGLMPPPAFASSDCMNGLRPALIAGGYSPSTDCTKIVFKVYKLVSENDASFSLSIYDLKYQTIPQGFGVPHWGQRLLIFKDQKYVGQYGAFLFSTPVNLVGSNIVFGGIPSAEGNLIRFGKGGLPSKAWIDGEIYELFK